MRTKGHGTERIPPLCGSLRFIHFHKNGPKMSGLGPEISSLCLDHSQENNVLPKGRQQFLFITINYRGQAGERRRAESQ